MICRFGSCDIATKQIEDAAKPIPMFLTCPKCNARHIDEGDFATKPHHTHSCQQCGLTWRPSIGPTVGVAFLPGFKNDPVVITSEEQATELFGRGSIVEDAAHFFLREQSAHTCTNAVGASSAISRTECNACQSEQQTKTADRRPSEATPAYRYGSRIPAQRGIGTVDRDSSGALYLRWGTCVDCPVDAEGRQISPDCRNRDRYDHQLKEPLPCTNEARLEPDGNVPAAHVEACATIKRWADSLACTAPEAYEQKVWYIAKELQAMLAAAKRSDKATVDDWDRVRYMLGLDMLHTANDVVEAIKKLQTELEKAEVRAAYHAASAKEWARKCEDPRSETNNSTPEQLAVNQIIEKLRTWYAADLDDEEQVTRELRWAFEAWVTTRGIARKRAETALVEESKK